MKCFSTAEQARALDSTRIVLKLDQACRIKTDKTSRHGKHFPNRLKYSGAAIWLIGAFRVLWFVARRLRRPYSHSAAYAEGSLSWWKSQTCTLWCLFTTCNQLLASARSGETHLPPEEQRKWILMRSMTVLVQTLSLQSLGSFTHFGSW